MDERIKKLEQQVKDLLVYKAERIRQQISFPVDDASLRVLGSVANKGDGGATLTQTISTSGATASVPAAFTGTKIFFVDGSLHEFPYIS